MRSKLGGRFFIFLGIVVGILVGAVVSRLQPNAEKAVFEFFFNIQFLTIILASYLIIQFSIGVPFERPDKSRSLHLGMAAIPIAYALLMHYITHNLSEHLLYFMLVTVLSEFPIVYTMLIGIGISYFVWFFVGLNTRAIDNKTLDSRAVFCYNLEFAASEKTDMKLIEKILDTTGFLLWRGGLPRNSYGGAIYRRKHTFLGVFCEIKHHTLNVVFLLFKIVDDTVVNIEDIEEAMDLQGQIHGLLNSWVERKKVFSFDSSDIDDKAIKEISRVLGPWKMPSRGQIRELFARDITKHKVLTWLVATIVGAGIVVILERSISMIWP